MAELIHECEHEVTGRGRSFLARVLGEPRGNVWVGWLEFHDATATSILRTGVETTQPNRGALAYWASGLEVVYLEGALARAR
jgi:hypothetical protein